MTESEPVRNDEKLLLLRDTVLSRLPEWDMGEWLSFEWDDDEVCGTTFCNAGFVLLNEGYKVDPLTERFICIDTGEIVLQPGVEAGEILGLNDAEASVLFYGNLHNSIDWFKKYIADILADKYRKGEDEMSVTFSESESEPE